MGRLQRIVGRWLLLVARTRFGGWFAAFACAYLPWTLPVRHIARTQTVTAFLHPRPEARDHVVLTPRVYAPSLHALVAAQRADVFADLVRTAVEIASARGATPRVLAINVGGRQEVLQLHGHLLPLDGLRTAIKEIIDEQVVRLDDAPAVLETLQRLLAAIDIAGEEWGGSVLVLDLDPARVRLAATVSAVENRAQRF